MSQLPFSFDEPTPYRGRVWLDALMGFLFLTMCCAGAVGFALLLAAVIQP